MVFLFVLKIGFTKVLTLNRTGFHLLINMLNYQNNKSLEKRDCSMVLNRNIIIIKIYVNKNKFLLSILDTDLKRLKSSKYRLPSN